MWKNDLRLAFRNLKRNKGYAAINVFGLAFGLAACFLIFLFVRHELSHDEFHEKSSRIYRMLEHSRRGKTSSTSLVHPAKLASFLTAEAPEVQNVARLEPELNDVYVSRGQNSFYESRFFYADSSFFDVFTFPLVRGNPETALSEPFSLVIVSAILKGTHLSGW